MTTADLCVAHNQESFLLVTEYLGIQNINVYGAVICAYWNCPHNYYKTAFMYLRIQC